MIPAPPPGSPAEAALREAARYRTRAKIAVSEGREVLENWDPQGVAGVDPEQWRLQVLAADRHGDLRRALAAARRAASLARTTDEEYRAALLLVLLEHETGHHEAELEPARRLVALAPRKRTSLLVLRRVAQCNRLSSLEQHATAALKAREDDTDEPAPKPAPH